MIARLTLLTLSLSLSALVCGCGSARRGVKVTTPQVRLNAALDKLRARLEQASHNDESQLRLTYGWALYFAQDTQGAKGQWSALDHPDARMGLWLLRLREHIESGTEQMTIKSDESSPLDGSGGQRSAHQSHIKLLEETKRALSGASPWGAALVWMGLTEWLSVRPLNTSPEASLSSARLSELLSLAESQWRRQRQPSPAPSPTCRITEAGQSPLGSSHYRCLVECPPHKSHLGKLVALRPWGLRRGALSASSASGERASLSPPRGSVWWLDEVNSLCAREPATRLTISLEAFKPPRLLWLLTLPEPTWEENDLTPHELSARLKAQRLLISRGQVSHALGLRRSPSPTLSSDRLENETLWRLWPRWDAQGAQDPVASTLQRLLITERPSEDQDERAQRELSAQINHLALSRGALRASAELWRILKAQSAPLPSEWGDAPSLSAPLLKTPHEPLGSEVTRELRWWLADLLIAGGRADAEVIPPLIRLDPSSPRALSWLIARPQWSPLRQLSHTAKHDAHELDPERVIRAHKRDPWKPLRRGDLGQLLDQQELYLTSRGDGVRWVTEVIRVNNRRGVEDLGELRLPGEARLISLYHRKALGGYRAPLRILTTGGYSLSDLQVGDYLVASYIEPVESGRMSGGVLTPRLPLVDVDRALGRREYRVFVESAERSIPLHVWLPDRDQVDAKRYSAQRRETPRGELIEISVERAQPFSREPASPPLELLAPAVRLGERLNPISERASAARILHRKVSRDLGLCEYARNSINLSGEGEGAHTRPPTVSQLTAFVGQRIQREAPLLDAPNPAQALSRGVGHRGLTLSALLSDCGYTHELWLARARDSVHDPSFEQLDDFDHVLIKWGDLWVDPDLSEAPLGIISGAIAGGSATPIWPLDLIERAASAQGASPSLVTVALPWDGATGRISATPPASATLDPSRWTHQARGVLRVDRGRPLGVLSAQALSGEMSHTFNGADGLYLYQRMSQVSPENLRGWIERQWSGWWGPSEVRDATLTYEDGVASLRYQLLVWVRPQREVSPAPQRWGARFANLTTRKHPLMLPIVAQHIELELHGIEATPQEYDKSITLPSASAPQQSADASSRGDTPQLWVTSPLASPPHEVTARFKALVTVRERSDAQPITHLKLTWLLSGGLVDPEGYKSWRTFALDIDQRERVEVRVQP